MSDAEDRKLASAVARLPREILPPNDGWQAIAARIEGERRAPRSLPHRGPGPVDLVGGALAAAAAFLCVLTPPHGSVQAFRAMTAVGPEVLASTWSPDPAPRLAPPAPEAVHPDEEPYRLALAALEDDFRQARLQLTPEDAAHLDASLRTLDEAIATTRAELAAHPDDFDLRTDLLDAYRDEVTAETDVIDLTTRT